MRKLDEASKRLFVGGVIADALRVVKPELAALLDLASIEPLPTEYVRGGKRFADAAFRVNFREGRFSPDPSGTAGRPGRRLYLLLAAEFQDANDAAMLERVREYADWQDAHYRQQNIVRDGEHPPLLALVFHTGPDRWTAEDGLEVYRALPREAAAQLAPHQRQAYIGIEVGRRSTLTPPAGNRLGAVVRLTRSATAEELLARLTEEWRRFGGSDDLRFRRGMRDWAQEIVLGLAETSIELPRFEELETATEEGTMALLEQHVREWRAELAQEGVAKGREEGERDALARLAERRFGADAAQRLSSALNGSPTRQRLDDVGDLVLFCRTAEEFVERLDG